MGGICITNKSLYPPPAVFCLVRVCNHNTPKKKTKKNSSVKIRPLVCFSLLPSKCHCVSTWGDITIINKESPSVSQR